MTKPIAMWMRHAKQRKLWLCLVRAFVSFAGIRDRLMLLNIPRGSKIIDIGCGGGRPVLTAIGEAYGVEPDFKLALQAAKIYERVYFETRAEKLPTTAAGADAVVSTDILGHIADKESVVREMYRVLKPGGVTLHVAEVLSFGWLDKIASREPLPYHLAWVQEPDHQHLVSAEHLVDEFRAAGFKDIVARPLYAWLPPVGFSALFKYHKHHPWWLRAWCAVDGLIAKSDVMAELVNVLLTPLSVVNWFAPLHCGLGVVIKARK